jgi:opacity protein-like surface antigen
MKKLLCTVAITAAMTTAAVAQSDAPAKSASAVKTAHTVNDGKAEAGRNSFTEAQAREHIAKSGYAKVSPLAKGSDGVWRGTALKDGATVKVALDFKGNVSTAGR